MHGKDLIACGSERTALPYRDLDTRPSSEWTASATAAVIGNESKSEVTSRGSYVARRGVPRMAYTTFPPIW